MTIFFNLLKLYTPTTNFLMKIAFQIDGGIGLHVSFSSITGGSGNTICNNIKSSARLGGAGNTLKHNCAAVFGVGITTVSDSAIHANNFVAQNICIATTLVAYAALPQGSLYTCAPAHSGFSGNPVFIK
jgi:hypothetical protein